MRKPTSVIAVLVRLVQWRVNRSCAEEIKGRGRRAGRRNNHFRRHQHPPGERGAQSVVAGNQTPAYATGRSTIVAGWAVSPQKWRAVFDQLNWNEWWLAAVRLELNPDGRHVVFCRPLLRGSQGRFQGDVVFSQGAVTNPFAVSFERTARTREPPVV